MRRSAPYFAALALASLAGAGCNGFHGRRTVDYGDPDILATPLMYECAALHLFLVDDPEELSVRVMAAPTCIPQGGEPYVMNYSVRMPDGDHFFMWNDADDYATEFVVPLDRRRDAELRRFDPEPEPRRYTLIKGERGIERIDGTPSKKWTCWSHAPGAKELREAAEATSPAPAQSSSPE